MNEKKEMLNIFNKYKKNLETLPYKMNIYRHLSDYIEKHNEFILAYEEFFEHMYEYNIQLEVQDIEILIHIGKKYEQYEITNILEKQLTNLPKKWR